MEQHPYKNIHCTNSRDDDSSTEVESLIGMDQTWTSQKAFIERMKRSDRTPCLRLLHALRWWVVIGLQITIMSLLVSDQGWLSRLGFDSRRSTSAAEVGGDITGWGPHIPTQITTFHVNQTFAPYNTSDFFTNETMRAWNDLMPIGMGFQYIANPSSYHDLPTPIVWDQNQTVYTTSMTHQLHCLFAIVEVYSGFRSNHTLPEDHHWHMIHCFDYMRQAILCAADMSLEGLETTFPDHNGGSDGWDSKHICRDPKAVRERLESVRAYDDQQIF